jgi:hypothetical protein
METISVIKAFALLYVSTDLRQITTVAVRASVKSHVRAFNVRSAQNVPSPKIPNAFPAQACACRSQSVNLI